VDILYTQLYFMCFIPILDGGHWVVANCCNGSRYKKGWKSLIQNNNITQVQTNVELSSDDVTVRLIQKIPDNNRFLKRFTASSNKVSIEHSEFPQKFVDVIDVERTSAC